MNSKIEGSFDLQTDHLIDIAKRTGADIIGLQFPEGFKRKATAVAQRIENATGVQVLISGNPCFGACDLDVALLDMVDILFHFGHAQLDDNRYSDRVFFIETRSNVDIKEVLEKAVLQLEGERIALITTVQHVHSLDEACKILLNHGKVPLTGRGDSKIAYPGQVLGCNFSVVDGLEFDECLYIGSGQFHPVGVNLATGRRVVVADPFSGEVRNADGSRVLKQRSAVIGNSMDAESFGIIVSTKPGQYRMELARELKEHAISHGKEAFIIPMDLITPQQLLQFKVDAFVNTACPRLAIDETGRYCAPMLTPIEFKVVLGEIPWEELTFDEIRGDP